MYGLTFEMNNPNIKSTIIRLLKATLTVHDDIDRGFNRRREVIVICEASHALIVVHSENTSIDLFRHFACQQLISPSQRVEF